MLLLGALGACDGFPDWFGDREDPPLPGERISVLRLEQQLEPDPRIADLAVLLPPPWRNIDWPQTGGLSNHAMHHLELGDELGRAWRSEAGAGSGTDVRLLSPPVVGGGRVYTMDAKGRVSAFDPGNGKRIWRVNLTPEDEEEGALGGGLAFDNGVLYASTGYGEVFALEPDAGQLIWKQSVGLPIRAAPAASGGRVFAITYDNQLQALAASDGRVLWTHSGLPEDAGLLGGAAPAVDGGIVVAPYSSGELFALRVENGRVVWGDQLIKVARYTPLAALSEIRGSPVIDRDRVFAISHSGRMAAFDLRTGERLWDRDIVGVETPWVAGNFLFIVTTLAEVVCLSRDDGRIRWVQQLQRFEDEEARDRPIQWSGPVLAGDRLILLSSHGVAASLSPYTGGVLGEMRLSDPARLAPVVADATLYIMTDGAELIALR